MKMLAIQLYCARHCELPLSKMGNKGLFPGVAVPLAFFCTLFFRHRKKSVSAPWDGQSQFAPESARHSPSKGISSAKLLPVAASRGACRSPPCTPFGSPTETIERPIGLQALLPRRSRRVRPRQRGFSYDKVVNYCCNAGGFPLAPLPPFGSPPKASECPIGLQALLPRRSRRVNPHRGQGFAPAGALGAFLGANNRRGPHCRASRLLFA